MSPQDKAPAYQWYVRDFMSDEAVALMSYEQQGIYRALLDRQWLEGSIPADPSQLAAILRIPSSRFVKLWPRVAVKFKAVGDARLANGRMERERQKADEYREASANNGRKGAAKRWGAHSHPNGEATSHPTNPPLAKNDSSSASSSASSSSSAVKSVYTRTRGAGAMGSSYASQSGVAYSYRGHTLYRGAWAEFVQRFNGDEIAARTWLDSQIDARYESGGAPGSMLKFIDECWEKKAPNTMSTNKTAGNIAALHAFVKAGTK